MKRRVRTQPSNPFYSNEPAVAKSAIAGKPIVPNTFPGNSPNKMIDKRPGKASGLAGFVDKKKPPEKGMTFKPAKPTAKTNFPTQGGRSSGHPKAHRIGSLKPLKGI